MHFILAGHRERNAVQTIIQVFYPNQEYQLSDKPAGEGISLLSGLNGNTVFAVLFQNGSEKSTMSQEYDGTKTHLKRQIKYTIYTLLRDETGISPPWGLLTGIRPAKVVMGLIEGGYDKKQVLSHMADFFLVSLEKAVLAYNVAVSESGIIAENNGVDTGLYIGIPFCPSKCLYCSFTSYPIAKHDPDRYIDALLKELAYARDFLAGRYLESVYIGGGTPTSLCAAHLQRLLGSVSDMLDLSKIKEYTVEAGRPDTITKEKLAVLKEAGVSRISINPQTMKKQTLQIIGRNHSKEEFLQAFWLAREMGFQDINVDLILGLPGEEAADVENTFREIVALDPDSITVHTLAIKRASRLKEEMGRHAQTDDKVMEEMLQVSSRWMEEAQLMPYYMYRQKNMIGNFENVGYCKPGHEGIYNVQIMEEKQSIVALGAGSTSKYVDFATARIERAFNVKNPDDYIVRIDEMINRKKELEESLW